MALRGVRGATTVQGNNGQSILGATRALLEEMVSSNNVQVEDIASVFFTATEDLDAEFPAKAARLLGWRHVPLLSAREIPVPGSLRHCVRVLLWWNTDRSQREVVHVYQGEARGLRPDLAGPDPVSHQEGEQ